jgi:predicted ATPase/tRNA A-37 threonylcarbamoyl transferase component Bud32
MEADWKKIRDVFEQALDLAPSPRAAFLDEACGRDLDLRREVEAMLEVHDRPGTFLTVPAPAPSVAPAPADRLSVGTIVDGKYRIDGVLGSGGMGAVYRATHLQLERAVAVKMIRRELLADRSLVERFRREAVTVARLRHPHIVTVHDYGAAEGLGAFLVMEMLEGRSLREEIALRGRFDVPTALELMGQACAAVGTAHREGVVHRDLKPENIFLEARADGRERAAKVLDFGLAKLDTALRSKGGALTREGAVLGTPAYMSPEQCRGEEADARSDVYALGCVTYEMLTGKPPFAVSSVAAMVHKHVYEMPRPPSALVPELESSVDEAVMRALAKAPGERHQTAEAFATALGAPVPGFSGAATGEGGRITDAIAGVRTGESPAPASPNNLPRAITRFIGRERQIADVRAWLGKTRLVTLVGPGGIGKTRLALEVAEQVMEDYPDGVWLVALASLADPALVTGAVASTLGVRQEKARSEIEALEAWLRERRLLLVLDNCEHVVDACAPLAGRLLETCPGLRMLATSREALSAAGEVAWPVPPLGTADEDESVRLFLDRAALANPAFRASESTAPVVAELCRRLEGIPLAIELAASRVKALSVERILDRLDDRLRLLSGGSRTAPTRQQTLRATLDWSYDLLTESERALLRAVSVFSGGWTLEAAEAVCQESDQDGRRMTDVLDVLGRLVDKSLATFDYHVEPRYTMLESIRQYAAERLRESGESGLRGTLHRDWFVRFAAEAYEAYALAEGEAWMARLDVEQDNLRAALQWSVERGEGESALRLCNGLMRFWDRRGRSAEGRASFDRALAVSAAVPAAIRGQALHDAGTLAQNLGDFEDALRLYEKSLVERRASGDERGRAQTLRRMGDAAMRCGRYDEAEAMHLESLEIYRAISDELGVGLALGQLGMVALARDEPERAVVRYNESLEVVRRLGHRLTVAITLHNLGEAEHRLGNFDRAVEMLEESLAVARESGYKGLIAMSIVVLSAVATDLGEYERAAAGAAESLALFEEIGDKLGTAVAVERTACVAAATGRAERALRLSGAATSMRGEIGSALSPLEATYVDRYVGRARASLGADEAKRAFDEGRAMTKAETLAYVTETVGGSR